MDTNKAIETPHNTSRANRTPQNPAAGQHAVQNHAKTGTFLVLCAVLVVLVMWCWLNFVFGAGDSNWFL
jgi:hypothetical protein